jgi:S1-C subfamily serine protease
MWDGDGHIVINSHVIASAIAPPAARGGGAQR